MWFWSVLVIKEISCELVFKYDDVIDARAEAVWVDCQVARRITHYPRPCGLEPLRHVWISCRSHKYVCARVCESVVIHEWAIGSVVCISSCLDFFARSVDLSLSLFGLLVCSVIMMWCYSYWLYWRFLSYLKSHLMIDRVDGWRARIHIGSCWIW